MGADAILSIGLARKLAQASFESGRLVGILIDRRGAVKWVIVGEGTRLYLPDIGRLRGGQERLRGLRLVVARPHPLLVKGATLGKKARPSLSDDFRTDLEKLRLDAVIELDASRANFDGPLVLGYLGVDHSDEKLSKVCAQEKYFGNVNALASTFSQFIDEVIADISRLEPSRGQAPVPGGKDRAILVGVYQAGKGGQRSMTELRELARSAQITVADQVIQYRHRKDPKTVVGLGKLEDICLHALSLGVEIIIFDCDLSPSQLLHITDRTDLKVLDRTMLILDIFAQRAVTREGKIQVEMAQLSYSLPRLAQKQSGLSRLTGGIGGRGPGETKLEVNKSRVKEKLARMADELRKIKRQRELRRKSRRDNHVPTFAIVGYTNAGKSTLLNALCGSNIYAKDELFATLDPHSRRLRFPSEQEVLITDTVGFIENLPPSLMKAFMATLEELTDADVLLQVVDASDEHYPLHMKVVSEVLNSLELGHKTKISVFNKVDLVTDEDELNKFSRSGVLISATTRQGFPELIAAMSRAITLNSRHNSQEPEETVFDEREG